jgi:hypothetical protein
VYFVVLDLGQCAVFQSHCEYIQMHSQVKIVKVQELSFTIEEEQTRTLCVGGIRSCVALRGRVDMSLLQNPNFGILCT